MCVLKDDILKYLGLHQRVRPCQIRHDYYLSRTRIHQVLKELLNEGKVVKSGKVPKVYYHMVRNRGFKI
ncbi:MAG: hypothetical protein ABIH84_00305 [bacterium]